MFLKNGKDTVVKIVIITVQKNTCHHNSLNISETVPQRPRVKFWSYELLAEKIKNQIAEKTLLPGEKLPSLRRISRRENVSLSTALHAYELLEKKGLIKSRPQSGYYVERLPEAPPEPEITRPPARPAYVNIGDTVSEILGAILQENIVPLGPALPAPELLPNHVLSKITAALCRRNDYAALRYESPEGSYELRRQLSRYSADWGSHLPPEDFIITAGCTEALSLSLRAAVKSGGVVAVESPAYYGSLMTLAGLGYKTLELPTHPTGGVILSELEKFLKKRTIDACLFTPNFNNPLGSLMPDEDKERLAAMLGRYETPLIEDDIYGDLYFGPSRPRTVKSFDQKGVVFLCSSFSKTLAPGYRVGYVAPGRYKEELARLKFMNTGPANTLSQLAIADYLANGGYDRHLQNLRHTFSEQVEIARELASRHFPPGSRISRPQGGLVLWIELPQGRESYHLYTRALAEKISSLPGHIFSNSNKYRHCLRISCGAPFSEKHRAALARLGELARE